MKGCYAKVPAPFSHQSPAGAGSARRGLANIAGSLHRRRQRINVKTCAVTNTVWLPKPEDKIIVDASRI